MDRPLPTPIRHRRAAGLVTPDGDGRKTEALLTQPAPWMVLKLTKRDRALLSVLTHAARCLAEESVAGHWWAGDLSATRRRLGSLESEGLIRRTVVAAHRRVIPEAPLLRMGSGESPPGGAFLGALAHRLDERWTGPAGLESCVWATSKAAKLISGASGRAPRASEASHDLSLGALYLELARRQDERSESWQGEHLLARSGERAKGYMPDAEVDVRGERRLIEYCGRYSKSKLERVVESAARQEVALELW